MAKQNEVGVLVKDNFEQHAQHVDKATKSYGSFKTAVASALNKSRLLGFVGALKSTVDALTNASKAEAEYIESMNLLKVAYDDNTASATNLINKLKDMYGLDPAGLTKTLGTYKQMTSAMGMANETSALLSENLLKMQEDVASLYNLDFATVGKKFQSALAGQSRALYSLGVDITKTSLQQELYNMGIDKNINELNKASKTALTYIVMEKQLQNAYGDAAKTINSLANQTKIWQEQTSIAARQIKALVIPVLSSIISYANGIMMAFNGVMEAILKFFGVDVEQAASQFGIGSVEIADGFNDIGTAAAGASKNIDKMKLGLRGFDKLNVITTPTDSGSSGGGAGGGAGGVDAGIAARLKEYNLKDAANNATKIRDAINEWLQIFNPLGESLKKIADLSWEGITYLWENVIKPLGKWAKETFLPKVIETLAKALDAVYETAKTMEPILKLIMEKVVIPFGKVLGKTIISILDKIKGAFELISKSKILQFLLGSAGLIIAFKKLIDIGKSLYTWFGSTKLGKIFTSFDSVLMDSIKSSKNLKEAWQNYAEATTKSQSRLTSTFDSIKLGIKGIIDAGLGFSMVTGSLQDMNDEGLNLINTLGFVAGAIMTVKGAIELATSAAGILDALFKTSFATNPFTAIIGGLVGVGALIWALETASDKTNELTKKNNDAKKYVDDLTQSIKEEKEAIDKSYESTKKSTDNNKKYVDELKNITDENGKIKEGYEDRAKFIVGQLNEAYGTEIKIIDGVIQKYKEELTSIEKLLEAQEAKIYLDIQAQKNQQAIEKETELLGAQRVAGENLTIQKDKQREISEKLRVAEEKLANTSPILMDQYKDLDNQVFQLKKDLKKQNIEVENAQTTFDNATKAYTEGLDERIKYQDMWVAYTEKDYGKVQDIHYNGVKNIEDRERESLVSQTKMITDLQGKDIIHAWQGLANKSEDAYKKGLDDLSLDQKTIIHQAVYGLKNDYGNDLINEYKNIGDRSETELLEELKKLPYNLQKDVINGMVDKGYQISENLQQGIEKMNPYITVAVDTSGARRAISNLWGEFKGRKLQISTSDNGVISVNGYAQGGFVNKGELFVAREEGPEMVGSINGKTTVANNDQIVEAISIGVAKAMSGRNTNVNIIADGDTQGLMKFINFKQQQQNRQYGL